MRYLLDTHVFIWLDNIPNKLSPKVASICEDLSNQLFVSLATIWEIQIKFQLGKLTLPTSLQELIERQQRDNRILLQGPNVKHILMLSELPDHHKDPFDRILIAQALVEGLTILSADDKIAKYPAKVIW